MTSGRRAGFGSLVGSPFGAVNTSYSKKGLEPPSFQDELNYNTSNNDPGGDPGGDPDEDEEKNKTLIIGASIVGGIVVIAGVAALAMRK